MVVGTALMLLTAIARLFARAHWKQILVTGSIVAAVGVVLWLLSPTLQRLGNVNLIIFFVVMLVFCIVIGVPIAFAFGLATMSYLAFATTTPMSIMPSRMQEGMSHLILLAVPLFVFLGGLIEMTGLAKAMIDFLVSLIGHVRGGLQYVLLGAMYLVSGISGAKAADMAAVAPALFPEMRKRGTNDGDLIGLLSASGAMSETIPPSIVLITVGSVTGVSITALFIGGLLPALVGLVMMGFVVWFQTRHEDMSGVVRYAPRQIAKLLAIAVPALALPFIIRTAVVEGVATATEVSTIGIFYTVLAGLFIYRKFDWRKVYPMLLDTASLSGAILHHRRVRNGDGVGAHAVGLFERSRQNHDRGARREVGIHRGFGTGLRDPRQRTGRDPGHRAVWTPAVSNCQTGRRARGALRDGRDLCDGPGVVLSAVRRGLLRGVCDWPRLA